MKRLYAGIMSLCVAAFVLHGCASERSGARDAGWITLFDGKNLDNFDRVGNANWRIVDGVLQADEMGGKETSYLVTKNAYTDFEIRAEFWVSDDANSGIYMRCPDLNNITDRNCTEANIFDQRPDPTYATGAITHLSAIKEIPKAGGKWNTFEITAQGPRIVVVLNGVKTAETDKSNALRGNIGLQWAQGVVKFRKVEIKPL